MFAPQLAMKQQSMHQYGPHTTIFPLLVFFLLPSLYHGSIFYSLHTHTLFILSLRGNVVVRCCSTQNVLTKYLKKDLFQIKNFNECIWIVSF